MLTFVAILEVTCIELDSRLCGINLHGTAALGVGDASSEAQLTFLFLVEYVAVVKSATVLNLFVVGNEKKP